MGVPGAGARGEDSDAGDGWVTRVGIIRVGGGHQGKVTMVG